MKRSRLGVGAKSLARGSTFPPPKQQRARKPAARDPTSARERELMRAWREVDRGPCVKCGAPADRSRGHHIITKQRLRQQVQRLGLDLIGVLWDRRNRLWACDDCHAGHHARQPALRWSVLVEHAPEAFQFAIEVDSMAWLGRTYPGP